MLEVRQYKTKTLKYEFHDKIICFLWQKSLIHVSNSNEERWPFGIKTVLKVSVLDEIDCHYKR